MVVRPALTLFQPSVRKVRIPPSIALAAIVEAGARRQKWIDQAQSLNIYMAGASGKKLDETYKLAWVRGLKTTYYLRTLAATSAEKSTGKGGELNAVPMASGISAATSTRMAEESEPKFCAIDDPTCESCQ